MQTSLKPLPKNAKALELYLAQANRDVDPFESIRDTQKFRVKELQGAIQIPYAFLVPIEQFRSVSVDLNKHMALGGPDANVLAPYLDRNALNEILRKRGPTQARMRSVAAAKPEGIDPWKPAAAVLAVVAETDAAMVELLKQRRRKIIAALEAETSADTGADNPKKIPKKVPPRLPKNSNVLELARRLNKPSARDVSKIEVALELTDGNRKKAQSLVRQLHRFPDFRS